MPDRQQLQQALINLDGAPYPAYKDLGRTYDFPQFQLTFTRFQSDPFASPSGITLTVPHTISQFPDGLRQSSAQCLGLRDYLARCLGREAEKLSQNLGSGNSGRIQVAKLGQEVLDRTVVLEQENEWEVRLTVGLPAKGRRIDGRSAVKSNKLHQIPIVSAMRPFLLFPIGMLRGAAASALLSVNADGHNFLESL